MLTGLGRLYYHPFQFKRMRKLVNQMRIAPDNLPDRLERLLTTDRTTSLSALEELVGETVALVRERMPGLDIASLQAQLRLGEREKTWRPPADELDRN